jgi:hypothetical protein
VTTVLFTNVVEAAFRRVDEGESHDYEINNAELDARHFKTQEMTS